MLKLFARATAASILLVSPAMAQTATNGPWAKALGTVNDAVSSCYTGSGTASIPALLCGLYKQAAPIGQTIKANSVATTGPLDPDFAIALGSITAADTATTTATGQNGTTVVTGTPTSGSVYSQAVNGQATAVIAVSNTWAGTINFEVSNNGGTSWSPRSAHLSGTGYVISSATANGVFLLSVSGMTNFRVRASALTSGTVSVQAETSATASGFYVMNPLRLFDAVSGNQATIKAQSAAAAQDPGIEVIDPYLYTLQASANTALKGFGTALATNGAINGAITPVIGFANSVVCKATAGNLYSSYATNLTSSALYLIVLNQATAPAANASITTANILDAVAVPANATSGVSYGNGPAKYFNTGIVTIVSTSASTFTAPTTAPFISDSCI